MNELETVRFPVHGMTCSSCVNRIARSLRKVNGVTRVAVDLGRETVAVTRARGAPDTALAAAVVAAGYEPDLSSATIVEPPAGRGLLDRLLGRWKDG